MLINLPDCEFILHATGENQYQYLEPNLYESILSQFIDTHPELGITTLVKQWAQDRATYKGKYYFDLANQVDSYFKDLLLIVKESGKLSEARTFYLDSKNLHNGFTFHTILKVVFIDK